MSEAIGYLRVSTREQGRSGLGLAAQRHEIEAFGARKGETRFTICTAEHESAVGNRLNRLTSISASTVA